MTTPVTIGGHELALDVDNGMLVVSIVADGTTTRRGSIFIGELDPMPDPVFVEPDPVAPQSDPN
ncbi:hypothetical protein ACL02S_05645 [Nocardia sp. 004]|uniref:hypothetical protein n=1 Tax=Nocardia sp. 004 TaxID=3385978 RepID=UPI00399F6901